MIKNAVESYDAIVIGSGHAGSEACLALSRLGKKTLLTTLNLDSIAFLACNPSIGGTAKGQLAKEVDALGGEMGVNADKSLLQLRLLNSGKGPAVQSLRAQVDKVVYHTEMKHTIEKQENLDVLQCEVSNILVENNKVVGIKTSMGEIFSCSAIVVATGVYLNSKIIIGDYEKFTGPNGYEPSTLLTKSLLDMGIEIRRFKTGTPARVDGKSIDFAQFEIQPGDDLNESFSYLSKKIKTNHNCYLGYTSTAMHDYIRENISRAPMYSGAIKGIGPRYCPSIEDKIMRFSDKERHQLFLEPESASTDEVYVQGISSSMPCDVQRKMYRLIPGFENVDIMRFAYAIEYDCINATELKNNLESKKIHGLFFAGQINGTSGYEEAAAQGIIAGINAAQRLKGEEQVILDRADAYIGVLIDDIVTKSTNEPYRMMTSRAEYRLLLRQDNADMRLTEIGHRVGLISDERYERFLNKKAEIEKEIERLEDTVVKPTSQVNEFLKKYGTSELNGGAKLSELLKRTELTYDILKEIDIDRPELSREVREEVEIMVKYEGYIKMQETQVEGFKKLERKILPEDIDYNEIKGIRIEGRQKLNKIRPHSIGQASRISGVSPADISVLLVYLEQRKYKENNNE